MTKNLAKSCIREPSFLSKHLRDEGPNWDSPFWAVPADVPGGLKPEQLLGRSEVDRSCPSLCSKTTFSETQDSQKPVQPSGNISAIHQELQVPPSAIAEKSVKPIPFGSRRLPNRDGGSVVVEQPDNPLPILERHPKSFESSCPVQPDTKTSPRCGFDDEYSLEDSGSEWETGSEASTCGHSLAFDGNIFLPSISGVWTTGAEVDRFLAWIVDVRPATQDALGVVPAALAANAVGGGTFGFCDTPAPNANSPSHEGTNYQRGASGGKRGLGPPEEDGNDDDDDRDRKRFRPVMETSMAPTTSHIFKRHNPALWCHHCWTFCGTEQASLQHLAEIKCSAAPCNENLMEAHQVHHIRQWRFRDGTDEEKWYRLVEYLFPHSATSALGGIRECYTPYYEHPATIFSFAPTPSQISLWGSDTSSNVSQVHQGSRLKNNALQNGDATVEDKFISELEIPGAPDSSSFNSLPTGPNNTTKVAGFIDQIPRLLESRGSLVKWLQFEPENSGRTQSEETEPTQAALISMSSTHEGDLRSPVVSELQKNNSQLRSELERYRQLIHSCHKYIDQLSELQEGYPLLSASEYSPWVLQFGSAVRGLRNSLASS
ncbi:hypothetical protein B0T25DRAFT_584481 [Lasiosphaeria hispida]|uniref:Uncharacterized protein n=1 Tax=Lasiosphaeria hispida TaxID=260671 RepID=A0AAJ0M9G7_9PEZI|nr:hypothetical protein B0T25DRAFT_584481 [Lasiosphaeria hispida]